MNLKRREVGDKTKGFTLQKQRALALFFEEVKSNPNAHVNVAIEYKGDVYLQNEQSGYIEEQKNYNVSSTFSFNSNQILNTLAYFLEIWLSGSKSKSLKFGFYSTNKIAAENNTERTKKIGINLPKKGVLKLVAQKKYSEDNLLDCVRKYLVSEYNDQYGKDITGDLDNDSLTTFLNSIEWYFDQDNEKEYKQEVLKKIEESEYAASFSNSYQPQFVYAALMLALEEKQDEGDTIMKFLRKDNIENFFLKVSAGQGINIKAHKYLNIDLSELKDKIETWLETFLESKYFSNVKDKSFPELIERKVARHNIEIKIERKNLEQTDPEKAQHLDVIVKNLGDLINDVRPTFLFGEIGSGKSTLLAHYFLNENNDETLPIFIPATYLKGKVSTDLHTLKSVINDFVNEELVLKDKAFDLDAILLTKKEITLIVDGLDELDYQEAQKLISNLLNLSASILNIRVIASGRPIELEELVNFNQWNCLTTLDLVENEIKLLLKNEAIASGLEETEAGKDAKQRWQILKSKQELLSNATTPLIVCLIRDFLDENLSSKTLGDILYEVLKRRLDWNLADQKENFAILLETYPHTLQREKFVAPIAYKLYKVKDGKINEDTLFQILNSDSIIPNDTPKRGVLVNETINFVKSNFLQKIGDSYIFQSHQLHQFAVGLQLFNNISAEEDFQYNDARINSWREISYAAAIARTKGESGCIEQYLDEVIDELVFTCDNTPATAVLLAEAQISTLNTKFLEKLKELGFRPLKFWGHADSLVPYSYAYIIKDLGKVGFDWFFEDYLNPKHPTATGHDDIALKILQHFLMRSQFEVTENEKNKLGSIIPFHLEAKTYSCNTLLPTIALSIPENFEIGERCILLADALRNNVVCDKAEDLLRKELSRGAQEEVENALEIACRSINYQPQNALRLWLEITNGEIPKLIIDNCLSLIGQGVEELLPKLEERIGKDSLYAYCRFNVLYLSSISDSAATIIYEHCGEDNPFLIAEPILKKSSWFDYKNIQREKILNEIIYNTEKGDEFIIRHIPNIDARSGIPELYLKYFLTSIQKSSNLYINDFLNVVRYLDKYSLPRYPEIREGFTKVLLKREYYIALKESLGHLDIYLRYNAASVLLVCNPVNEKEALEIIIRSASKNFTDNKELLRLCMKLNFSKSMLDFIYDLLNELTELSKVFAIKLLYHNNEYRLNNELLGELITGLLGDAYYLDWSGNLSDDGVDRVVGQEKLYSLVRTGLNSDKFKIRESSASSLLYYYSGKLKIKDKAYCWLLHIQYSERALIDFHERFQHLFEDSEFVQEIKDKAKEIEKTHDIKEPLLLKYYEAIREKGDWKDFFLALLKKGRHLDLHLDDLYVFITRIGNSASLVKKKMGKSIKELMAYPIFSQDKEYNSLIPQLAILAHEFGELTNLEITQTLTKYRIFQQEVACALLSRLGSIPQGFHSERGNIEHIAIFAKNPKTSFKNVGAAELMVLLEDGEDIPIELTTAIESVLLKGDLTNKDLIKLSAKGNLATYFSIVVGFSRNPKMELQDFAKAGEIGGPKYFARVRTQHHKSILLKIKEALVSDDAWKESYVEALINDITDRTKSIDVVDLFTELFSLNANFDARLLPNLFEVLLQTPYRCNLNLVYWINEYVINLDDEKQKELIKPLKTVLKAVNSSNERHENELELMAWSLSLILLYVEKKVDKDIERGFLTGLKNIYIQTSKTRFVSEDQEYIQFRGRDLLISSDLIISKIDSKLFHKIIKKGLDSNVPEIRSLCKMLSVLSN